MSGKLTDKNLLLDNIVNEMKTISKILLNLKWTSDNHKHLALILLIDA